MAEMWGLEPQTPYMRSDSGAKACYIRLFGLLRCFLPILLPTQDRVNNRLHADLGGMGNGRGAE